MWVGFTQLVKRLKRENLRFPLEEGILPQDCNRNAACVSSQLVCPTDYRLTSPQDPVSQFLKINIDR